MVNGLAGRYRPGWADWWKVKRRRTVEAIIGGVLGDLADPPVLLLGRLAGAGRLRHVGGIGLLTVAQRAEAVVLLTAAAQGHPWPSPLPAAWSGRFDRSAGPEAYVRVEPVMVAEIVVDGANAYLVRGLRRDLRGPERFADERGGVSAGGGGEDEVRGDEDQQRAVPGQPGGQQRPGGRGG